MTSIAIIGGGNMGYAIAAGMKNRRPNFDLVVADPIQEQRDRLEAEGISTTASNQEAISDADVVVLAVKPQIIEAVATELAVAIAEQLVVSIAAGTPLDKLNAFLGSEVAIVRCMPNTPALIGEGITGMLANANVSSAQKELAESILSVCGDTAWFQTDDDLDKVTALSGSGPAYFFYLIEALVAAGESMGMDRETAKQLAVQTAVGASTMALQDDSDPSQLRENVTSPGGTTEAALNHLAEQGADETLIAAVNAAYRRAKELAT